MEWEIYPTSVQGKLGLMLVDLSYMNSGKEVSWGFLNWFRVGYLPDSQGFPSSGEQAELEIIGERLVALYEGRGALAGRLSVDGRREFFVYASDQDAQEVAELLRQEFPGRRLEARGSEDAGWEVYDGFLCPDAPALQRLASYRGMQALQAKGDVVSVPRPVLHAAAFMSEEACREFGLFVEELGFEVTSEEELEDEAALRPFVLRCVAEHPVDPAGIERYIMPLFQRARELGGEYGGWQCSAVLVS